MIFQIQYVGSSTLVSLGANGLWLPIDHHEIGPTQTTVEAGFQLLVCSSEMNAPHLSEQPDSFYTLPRLVFHSEI